jgi:CheY-like chemotaxis protein
MVIPGITGLVDFPRATRRRPLSRYVLSEFVVQGQLDGPEGDEAELEPAGIAPEIVPFHILIVDDDASIRDTLVGFLEDEGYSVEAARNGAEALQCIARQRPTLVLLDMRMPIMDGWAFAAELRVRGIDVPLIVMTAAPDARVWAQEIGATAFVAKPFDFAELLSKLQGPWP